MIKGIYARQQVCNGKIHLLQFWLAPYPPPPKINHLFLYLCVLLCVYVHSERSYSDLLESNCVNQINLASVIKIIF